MFSNCFEFERVLLRLLFSLCAAFGQHETSSKTVVQVPSFNHQFSLYQSTRRNTDHWEMGFSKLSLSL